MKYAEVTYTGPMTSNTVHGPSNESYRFRNPMGGSPRPTTIEDVDDALFFERQGDPYTVEWSTQGKLAKKLGGPVSDVKEALSDVGYHEKKRLAKAFGVKPEASHPTQEELDAELEPVVEDLKHQMEN